MAVRTQPHIATPLQLVEELWREMHVAAQAGSVAHLDDRGASAALEDLLVFLQELVIERRGHARTDLAFARHFPQDLLDAGTLLRSFRRRVRFQFRQRTLGLGGSSS